MKNRFVTFVLFSLVVQLLIVQSLSAEGIRSGRKAKAESIVHAESCPETLTTGGHSTVTVRPGNFGFLCFKMEIFDAHGEIVKTGIPTRPGGMADAAVSEALDAAARKCESKALVLDDFERPAKTTFSCTRTYPAGWAMGGNLAGAIQQMDGEITEEQREAQDSASGVGPLQIKLVTRYECSAKAEAYCR